MDADWLTQLAGVLAEDGVLAVNFVSGKELKRAMQATKPVLDHYFTRTFGLKTPQNYNTIGVFTTFQTDSAALRAALVREPALNPQRRSAHLRYSIRLLAGIQG